MQLSKNRWTQRFALSAVAMTLVVGGAFAQSGTGSVPTVTVGHALPKAKSLPALSFKSTPVDQIVDTLARDSGIPIVTNTLIAGTRVDFTTLGGSLDAVLTELARVLPPMASVRAVLLPNSLSPSSVPDGDTVVAYLTLQDSLAAAAAAKPASVTPAASEAPVASTTATPKPTFVPGEFEALGRRLAADKAAALSADMNLRPVYVVSTTRPPVNPITKMAALQAEALRNYAAMTPDQRKTAMEQQFNDMMNMDKGARQALLGQMMDQGATMVNMMKNMPPAQMQEFQSEMMTAMQNSGMAGALGGGAGKGGGTGK